MLVGRGRASDGRSERGREEGGRREGGGAGGVEGEGAGCSAWGGVYGGVTSKRLAASAASRLRALARS